MINMLTCLLRSNSKRFTFLPIFVILVVFIITKGETMASNLKVAVVTGANKGIGFEIAKKLGDAGLKVIVACRNEQSGQTAKVELMSQGISEVEFRQCDIASTESVDNFVAGLSKDYASIDVLVNNAAIAFKASDPTPFKNQAASTIQTNFFGTLYLTKSMLPLLKSSPSPRIVNVASQVGHLSLLKSPERIKQFTDPSLSLSKLESLMNEFVQDVESGQHELKGWPNSCYGMSKLGVVALTKILARDEKDILINTCCPGYCKTDMSSNRGTRSAEAGAQTPAYLALAPLSESGKFFYDEHEIQW